MKKIFIFLIFIFSLCFISCASKDIPVEEPLPENVEIIENSQTSRTADEKESEALESSDSSSQTEEPELSDTNADNSMADNETLDDIEEPVVITLEPEEISEPEITDTPADETSETVEEEAVEEEILPEIKTSQLQSIQTIQEPLVSQEDIFDVQQEEPSENPDDVISLDDVISVDENNSIDISEDNIEDTPQDEPLPPEEIIPSRKVTMKKLEYVDISYPGTGWIYMGLVDGSKDLSYFGRKLGTTDTKFTLQARNKGTKIAHFYKNDPLTNQYLDDYIEIEILGETGSNKTHIEAPEYKQPVPKKMIPEQSEINTVKNQALSLPQTEIIESPAQEMKTISPPPTRYYESEPAPVDENKENEKQDAKILLQEAELLYNEKEFKAALEKLNLFFEYSTTKRDEGLYLKGQILESKSEVQNIKEALESYTTLTKNYPSSKLWDKANKRIIYLKRFYFGG